MIDWILRNAHWDALIRCLFYSLSLFIVLEALLIYKLVSRLRISRFENDETHAREDEGMSEFCYDVPKRGDH